MDDTAKGQVDVRTAEAINNGPFQDFRETYRQQLRWLKETNPQGFSQALNYYNDVLARNIAAGYAPLLEWLEYGRTLAQLSGPGTVYSIDEGGRAQPAGELSGETNMLLHLPDDSNARVFPIAMPRALSPAQQATFDLLVNRKLAL